MGLGTSLEKCFVLRHQAVLLRRTNAKLHVFNVLFDNETDLSDPIVPLEAGRVFNDIHNRGQILYESY